MHKKLSLKNLSRFTRGKVMIAFVAAGVALASSWAITRIVFSDMADSVIGMSQPNRKLLIVDRLLLQVSSLDQLQRVQVIKKPDHTRSFLSETQEIRLTLDTLAQIYSNNPRISRQIDTMKLILTARDQVYIDYATLRAGQLNNAGLSGSLRNITGLVKANARMGDSSVRTTETTITTTAAPKKEEQVSLWKRIFGKKKKEENEQFVREEMNVRVDTLAVARQDSIVTAIEKAMTKLEREQTTRTSTMLLKELSLVNNGNTLVNELWRLLHNIQEEEINNISASKDQLISDLDNSITRAGLIMLLLFVVIGIMVFLVLNDITRSNLYREQLRLARDQAEHLGLMKQRFLSNMSHEIRTPLQSIIGFSEQVREQDKPRKEMLDAIHASAGHLLQIVNEVLDYSRIISGKFVLEKRSFSMDALAREVSDTMKMQAEPKGLRFVLKNMLPPGQHYLGDDFRLKQVLYNLLGNAVKFTSNGTVSLLVSQAGDTEISLVVSDTGTGISPENLERIFNEFEQTDSSVARKYGGTGLGLSITKALVEQMGGSISAESEEGSGTSFILYIPLEPAGEAPAFPQQETDTLHIENLKTVLVEDDPFILELCRNILTNRGITHRCYSSAEALLNSGLEPDTKLLFSDIRLPGMPGTELVKKLRSSAPNVRFVALTAQVLPEEKAYILSQGFDDILAKPFREHELLSFYSSSIPDPGTLPGKPAHDKLDLSILRQMTMDDDVLLYEHLERFVTSTSTDLALFIGYLENKSQPQLYELIHKMAGRMGQIGATQLMRDYRELESELKYGKLAGLEDRLHLLASETENMIAEVKEILDAQRLASR